MKLGKLFSKAVLLLIVTFGIIAAATYIKEDSSEQIVGCENSHRDLFFDEELFYRGLSEVEIERDFVDENIYGGIIPHHLLPGSIIARNFLALSTYNPKTVILVGPNHYDRGGYHAITSKRCWSTREGLIAPEKKIIENLVENNLAGIDEEIIEKEHSVSGVMSYLKHFVPRARVVPIILSSSFSLEEAEELSDYLAKIVSGETVLVAAVDFSHHLSRDVARERDEETLKALKDRDYETLFTLNSEYLDSPGSIVTLLMTMDKIGVENSKIIDHTNSGYLVGDGTSEVTSYYSIIFSR